MFHFRFEPVPPCMPNCLGSRIGLLLYTPSAALLCLIFLNIKFNYSYDLKYENNKI
jgi:hypothetical protein